MGSSSGFVNPATFFQSRLSTLIPSKENQKKMGGGEGDKQEEKRENKVRRQINENQFLNFFERSSLILPFANSNIILLTKI